MHPSSMRNMQICYDRYISPLLSSQPERRLKVVDIGSQDVNGSYRTLFSDQRIDYLGIDMAPGPGVDLVTTDPYRLPLDDGFADVVISGQMLEHSEFFWLTFAEKVRIANNSGFIVVIAPAWGPIHRYPVDCYRFYPDAYAALAKYTNSILIDCWVDVESEWGDLVGVFVKRYRPGITRFDTGRIG